MNVIKTFRIIVGVLLLVSTVTIFALLFLEIESLAVLFNFGFDISAGNLAEAIVGMVAGLMTGLMFFIAMIIVGIFNAIIYTVFGVLTITLKRTKTMPIIISVISAFTLFIGIRALIILTLGGFTSIILPLRIATDIIIITLSIISLILIFRDEKIPRA
ncbi:MAG: hypothetical protein ACFFCG_13365 [Promethearchaeota archaeon]